MTISARITELINTFNAELKLCIGDARKIDELNDKLIESYRAIEHDSKFDLCDWAIFKSRQTEIDNLFDAFEEEFMAAYS